MNGLGFTIVSLKDYYDDTNKDITNIISLVLESLGAWGPICVSIHIGSAVMCYIPLKTGFFS